MSRKIDVSDPAKLSEDDIRYLQERDRLPEGVEPLIQAGLTNMGLEANTGFVTTHEVDGGNSIDPPGSSVPAPPTESIEDMTVSELKDEIDRRNADRPEDEQLSKSGNKEDLLQVLRDDDEVIV